MTKEEQFVVNPLQEFLLNPQRSGAAWAVKHRPKHGTSATGWDLQVERKNRVLLIEAKYITGPFASALAGLLIAPLTRKEEKMKSWAAVVAWAIGCGYKHDCRSKYKMAGVYQALLDFLARNVAFWNCYSRLLKVEYIFFVDRGKVARIRFNTLLTLAESYAPVMEYSVSEKRDRAEELMSFLSFK